jgi:putative copper export protein
MHAALIAIELLAASVWTGGLVTIAVVARCARQQLDAASRVAFFRTLGRRYLCVGLGALVAAYGAGAVLIEDGHWSGIKSAIVVAAAALFVVTLAGVIQARSLTRLRAAALAADPRLDPSYLARQARRAGALRGLIATLTVTLVVLAAISIS